MKKYLILFLLCTPATVLFGQLNPLQNDLSNLKKKRVKSLEIVLHTDPQERVANDMIILSEQFDPAGNPIQKMQLFSWGAVSYSYTTLFQYREGLLIQKDKKQKILDLCDRDHNYIDLYGDSPLNELTKYLYNDQQQKIREEIFTYSGANLQDDAKPVQILTFEYKRSRLVKETSHSEDSGFFNKNYDIEYKYDSLGRIYQKTLLYGKEKTMKRITSYIYDSLDRKTEEQTIDFATPHNNQHLRFIYNNQGRLSQKLLYDAVVDSFEVEETYYYDSLATAIPRRANHKLTYYPNGLLRTESWISQVTGEHITLSSSYTFFNN